MGNKSILVMDTPKDCLNCKMRHVIYCEHERGYQQCGFNTDGYKLESFFKESDLKDGWISPKCPLKPLPDKKKEPNMKRIRTMSESIIFGFCSGWNACIDEITGGDE